MRDLKLAAIAIGATAMVAVFVVDYQQQASAAEGHVSLVAGGPGRGTAADVAIGSPFGMAIQGTHLYVVDYNSEVVRVIDTATRVAHVAAGYGGTGSEGDGGLATLASLDGPIDVAIDVVGRFCFSEQYHIRCVEPDGTIKRIAGTGNPASTGDGGPALSADIFPDGIAFDAAGNLYMAEPETNRVRRITTAGIIEPFAGTGVAGFGGDGGPATAAALNDPDDIAVDAAGNVYITDNGNARIRIVTPDGTITTICGGGTRRDLAADGFPALEAANCGGFGIAVHPDGSVYFTGTRSLWKVDTDGILRRVAGDLVLGDSGDGGPARDARVNPTRGLTIDPSGIVYVADYETRRVRYIDPSGIIRPLAGNGQSFFSGDGGPAREAQLDYPWDVASDRTGGFYVTEGGRVRHVRADGTIATLAVTGIGLTAIDVLPNGDPIIVDVNSGQARTILPGGTIVVIAGHVGRAGFSGDGGPATSAFLNQPEGVAVGPDGSIYIGDTQNNRVRRIDPQGRIHTFAGSSNGSNADGIPAVQASLVAPTVVTADAIGNVYFAEPYGYRIRRVDRDGVITTYVGTGIQGFSGDGGPANTAQLDWITGIRADQGGNLVIATGNRIRMVNRHGVISTLLGDGTCCSNSEPQSSSQARVQPFGVSIDSDGRILFGEEDGRRVRRVDVPDLCPQLPGLDVSDANGDGVGDDCECIRGTACADDGNPCTSDVCDDNQVCTHPAAAAGTICRAVAGDCDVAEVCDGVSSACPADTGILDKDADGVCDAQDPCTNVARSQDFISSPRSKIVVSGINTDSTPGNDKLAITAFFDLPPGRSFSELRPDLHGARVVLDAVGGTRQIDVMLPPGAYTPTTRAGWRPGANGKVWTFTDRASTPLNGIVKLTVTDRGQAASRRRVKVVVTGKNGVYPIAPADSPVRVSLTLGDAADAAAGMCGESAYTATDCVFNRTGNRLVCKR